MNPILGRSQLRQNQLHGQEMLRNDAIFKVNCEACLINCYFGGTENPCGSIGIRVPWKIEGDSALLGYIEKLRLAMGA